MTLKDFSYIFWTMSCNIEATTIYVFESEEQADSWVNCHYSDSTDHNYELIMALQSDMKIDYIIKDEWCNAEVTAFYAVEADKVVVIVERGDS